MSQDNHDFESLRRLLAVKRYEQPPPGYFNGFANQVIRRLEAGEGADEGAWVATWLQRLWAALETRPVMAGTFGATVCALLAGAVIYSDSPQIRPALFGPAATTVHAQELPTHDPSLRQPVSDVFSSFPDQSEIPDNPFLSPPAQGIFPVNREPHMNLAGFNLAGGN